MAFESLSDKLQNIFKNLRGKGRLTEEDVKAALKEVKIEDLTFNPFTKIGKEWMLITAGNEEKHNTMTASWGGVGIMWGMNVATAYIRPQRYTKEFVDAEDMYTLSFFKEEYRKALDAVFGEGSCHVLKVRKYGGMKVIA